MRAGLKIFRHGGAEFLSCEELKELGSLISERLGERQFTVKIYQSATAIKREYNYISCYDEIGIDPGDTILSALIRYLTFYIEEIEQIEIKLHIKKQINVLSSMTLENPFPCYKITYPSARRKVRESSVLTTPEFCVYGIVIPNFPDL